ncbi:glycosyltransferase [Thomasclavelia cocleata]|uniref:glycosyltransferase n=1 Tax=Thomasclavelia cocleata TaxID=69824 RepID=UPI00255B0007|nr:glycosyltransferase [Thomasclavelia cocleata]
MNNLISVIVPVYNVEKFLVKCVDSILAQTYTNLEIILVDDGSPDNCPAICDELAKKDSRIKVIHKENGGASSARNAGLDIAKGEYIGFVDGDDYIAKDMYEYLLNLIEKNDVDVAQIQSFDVDEYYNIISEKETQNISTILDNKAYIASFLQCKGTIALWASLFQKDFIGDLRLKNGTSNEDILFEYYLFKNGGRIFVDSAQKYYYYQNNNSISRQRFTKCHISTVDNAIEIYNDILVNNFAEFKVYAEFLIMNKIGNYLYLIPKNDMKNNHCQFVINYLKQNKAMLNNKFLSKKHKYFLKLFLLFPNLTKYIVEKYLNRKK